MSPLNPVVGGDLDQRFAIREEIESRLDAVEAAHNADDAILEDLQTDFGAHKHDGTDSEQVDFGDLLNVPTPDKFLMFVIEGVAAGGSNKLRFRLRAPEDMTLTNVRASAVVAPTGSAYEFDVKDDGGIVADGVQIANGQQDVDQVINPTVFIQKNSVIQVDVIEPGSTTPAEEIHFTLVYK